MKLCYSCAVVVASMTGRVVIGQSAGNYGRCAECRLYSQLFRTTACERAVETPPVRWVRNTLAVAFLLVVLSLLVAKAARCAPQNPQDEGLRGKPSLEEWTQRAIRRLPVYYEDNPPGGVAGRTAAKEAQLTAIAHAVALVSRKAPLPQREWAALLLTIGFHETTFSLRVHAGDCRPHECDRGRSRGPFQQKRNVFNAPIWDRLVGVENTETQVRFADAFLRRFVVTCKPHGEPSGILTGYAGQRCGSDWKGLQDRLETFRRLAR